RTVSIRVDCSLVTRSLASTARALITFPLVFLSSTTPPPPSSTLFPYTTLFRSLRRGRRPAPAPPAARRTPPAAPPAARTPSRRRDRKSTRLNSSHQIISYAVFSLKKKKQ